MCLFSLDSGTKPDTNWKWKSFNLHKAPSMSLFLQPHIILFFLRDCFYKFSVQQGASNTPSKWISLKSIAIHYNVYVAVETNPGEFLVHLGESPILVSPRDDSRGNQNNTFVFHWVNDQINEYENFWNTFISGSETVINIRLSKVSYPKPWS